MELDGGVEQDALQDDGSTADGVPSTKVKYRKRAICRVIRYRHYELDDMREMVTLSVPFRNEVVDVLDQKKFIQIYHTKERLYLTQAKRLKRTWWKN